MAITETVRATGLPLDNRGLIALKRARAEVARASEFRKGRGRFMSGTQLLDSDVLWACLMSLEDPGEFVREATRLRWYFHPRRHQNLEPLERYGAVILPWLASFVRDHVLVNVPWCVVPCLIEIGTSEVWDMVYSLRDVVEDPRSQSSAGPGPFAADSPGDVDALGLDLAPRTPAERSDSAVRVILEFIDRHASLAIPPLAAHAAEGAHGDGSLMQMLVLSKGPSAVFGTVAVAWGEAEAASCFTTLGLPRALTEQMILNVLDQSAESVPRAWPMLFQQRAENAYHALRLVALRERGGDGWVVVFERLEGSSERDLAVRRYATSSAFGCGELPEPSRPELFLERKWSDNVENTLVGPAGDVIVTRSVLDGLEPRRATAPGVDDMQATLLVRAYLEEEPAAFWSEREELVELLGLEDYEVIVDAAAFEHVVGTAAIQQDPDGVDRAWHRAPSQSAVYQSLARALVARDAGLFEAGVSNLSWRLHLERCSDQG